MQLGGNDIAAASQHAPGLDISARMLFQILDDVFQASRQQLRARDAVLLDCMDKHLRRRHMRENASSTSKECGEQLSGKCCAVASSRGHQVHVAIVELERARLNFAVTPERAIGECHSFGPRCTA